MNKYIIYVIALLLTVPMFSQVDLDFYISQAKANNALIKDNINQAEASKFDIERLKALYTKPQVILTAGVAVAPIINRDNGTTKFEVSPGDANKYIGYDIAASNGGIYQGMVNVNQPLFNNKKLITASEQIMVANKLNENNIKITEHDIEKIVGDQYILCLQDVKQTDYLIQLIELVNEQKLVVIKLVESGLLKQSDLLMVSIEQQTLANTFLQFKLTYKRDLMDLNILCGINDTTTVIIKSIDLQINSAVTQSNFTEKYRIDSLSLLAAQKNFDLKYKPQFSAFANAGLNGVYVPTLPNRFGVSGGLNFSMYLFDGKQKSINHKKTDILIKSTQSYKSNFINQNDIRKYKLLAEIASLNERMNNASNQLKDYNQLLKYYKTEVISGQQLITTYITTIKNLAAVQRDYVLMQSSKQLLINNYNYWNW